MTLCHLYIHMPTMSPLCRPVPAAEARAEAEAQAARNAGRIVYVLTAEQAQVLAACEPECREGYLARECVPSVCVPKPEPLWDNDGGLDALAEAGA